MSTENSIPKSDKSVKFTEEVCQELYEVLKDLTDALNCEWTISYVRNWKPYLEKAEQALKKARGEE